MSKRCLLYSIAIVAHLAALLTSEDQKKDPTVVLEVAQRHFDVENLNQVQRKVYEKAMQAVDNPDEQLLIDVCGSAGTGKSYTINTILQQAEAGSVQILAPTGAAACQFVGGKTLHSFLKLNVTKSRSQKGQEKGFKSLTEAQAQNLERNLQNVKLLITDEKGVNTILAENHKSNLSLNINRYGGFK